VPEKLAHYGTFSISIFFGYDVRLLLAAYLPMPLRPLRCHRTFRALFLLPSLLFLTQQLWSQIQGQQSTLASMLISTLGVESRVAPHSL
jgi:hypothetical protein